MKIPNTENKVIFHDWQPRELQALIRATAILHSKQPKKDPPTPLLRAKNVPRGGDIVRRRKP